MKRLLPKTDRERKHRLRLSTPALPVVVGLLFIVYLISPADAWLALLVGFATAWVFSYSWARSLAHGLGLRREMRFGWAQVGDSLEERFTLQNNSPLPALWVDVRDQTNMPGYNTSRATGMGGMTEISWRTRAACSRRGLFHLGPTSLHTGDPLGIFRVTIEDPRETALLVTPPIVPLPRIEVAAGGRSGEGRPRPNAPERTVSASGVREYTPGDTLRWIHWRTTARMGDPYVRLFEGTPAGDWWIVLDMDQKAQVGEGQDSTEEHGVILAASLLDRGLQFRRAVGIAVNGDPFVWSPPREGEGQRWEALRSLALVSPGERSIDFLLDRVRSSFGHSASLVIITANTNPSWLESLLPLVWLGIAPTVLLLDPATFGGKRKVAPISAYLSELGIQNYVIPKSLLDRPEARPGQKGRWEWKVSATGRAIALERPESLEWKELK